MKNLLHGRPFLCMIVLNFSRGPFERLFGTPHGLSAGAVNDGCLVAPCPTHYDLRHSARIRELMRAIAEMERPVN